MSKTSQCIYLLQILYSRSRVVGVAELADMLETNPRNIPEYIRELKDAGYDIRTVSGRYGGYILERRGVFPSVKLTDSERAGLMAGYEYLLSRNDFMEVSGYGRAMAKISSAIMSTDIQSDMLVANRFPLAMPKDELESRYFAINQCIANKNVLQIDYLSLDNSITTRLIHPYKLYMYNNAWFVLAYDEMTGEIRYFKINRIQKFEIKRQKFRVLLSYNEHDYVDEFGMKQNGEWYHIKLKLTGNYAMLAKERIYGKEQTVETVDDSNTILSCKMQNKESIKSFVLGFGDHCEVLEPEWLREVVMEAAKKTAEIYSKQT